MSDGPLGFIKNYLKNTIYQKILNNNFFVVENLTENLLSFMICREGNINISSRQFIKKSLTGIYLL